MSTKVARFTALKTAASDGVSSGPNVASCGTAFDGNQSIGANCYSLPLELKQGDTLSLQVSMPATSTGQGTVTLQGSNYPYDSLNPSANSSITGPQANATFSTVSFWDEATGLWLQTKTVTNAATTFLFTVPIFGASHFRVLWTNTTGTAPVRMDLQVKSDGH
jgi:hypothetical protein